MLNALVYIIPPLLGAAIGWLTNALAIKMLFRPLEEKRIFSIRVPFTPGILPRQRKRLAQSIGRMVQRELITEDMLRERLADPSIAEGIGRGIATWSSSLLALSPKEAWMKADDLAKERFSSTARALLESLLERLLASPSIDSFLERAVHGLLEPLLDKEIRDLFPAGKPLDGSVEPPLDSGRLEASLGALWPDITNKILELLAEPQLRRALEQRGRVFLDETIQRLNSFQRFFISAAQYDASLGRRMPEIVDSLVKKIAEYLSSEEGRSVIISRLSRTALEWISAISQGRLFKDEEGSGAITVRSLLCDKLGLDTGLLLDKAGKALSAALRRRDPSSWAGALESYCLGEASLSLAERFPLLVELKSGIDRHSAGLLLSVVSAKLPEALAHVDIEGLVVRRIDSLEMIRVERIILDVLTDQLKWINVFGAILGALIGGSQVLINLFLS